MSNLTPAALLAADLDALDEADDGLDQRPFTGRVQEIELENFPVTYRHDGHSWGRTDKLGLTLAHPVQPAAEYESLTKTGWRLWLTADGNIMED